MSEPVNLHTYNFGREAVDDDGNHYTLADTDHSWTAEWKRDGDEDTEHNYITTDTDENGDASEAKKDWPW